MSDVITDWPRNRVLGLLALGRRHGVDEARLLAGTGTGPTAVSGPGHGLDRSAELVVVRNLLEVTGRTVGPAIEAGQDFHLHAVGSWGRAVRTSSDFGSAITLALGLGEQVPTAVGAQAKVRGDELSLALLDDDLPADVRAFVSVRMLVFMAMTARELLGRPLPTRSVRLNCDRPHDADALDSFYGRPVTWSAGRTVVAVDASVLAEPLTGADPTAHRAAVAASRAMVRAHSGRTAVTERVQAHLTSDGEATLPEVATALGVSQRGLRRHLAAEGTSFRTLQAASRLALARTLLDDDRPLDEVAQRLGYSEQRAFARAFRSWVGVTPTAYRRGTDSASGSGEPVLDRAALVRVR